MPTHLRRLLTTCVGLLLCATSLLHAADSITLEGVIRIRTHRDQVQALILETSTAPIPLLLNHTARRLALHSGETVRITGVWRTRDGARMFAAESFSVISAMTLRPEPISGRLMPTRVSPPDVSGVF